MLQIEPPIIEILKNFHLVLASFFLTSMNEGMQLIYYKMMNSELNSMVRTKTKHKRNINNSKRRKGLVGSCVILDQIKPIMENIQSRGLKRPGGPAEEWNTLLHPAKKY